MPTIILVAAAAILVAIDRNPICTCGTIDLWVGERDSPKTSQMLADWYSLSHIVHGLLFYAALWLVARRWRIEWRFLVALLVGGLTRGCTSLGDEFSGGLIHMNKRDVTFVCFSRAPIDRLAAYKARMGWEFPYVSTYESDFPFDFGLAMTEEQAQEIPEVKQMIDDPPGWLEFWSEQVGAELKDGLREGPGYIAFARDNGTVYHTYTVMAPDPFVAPAFGSMLDRTAAPQPEDPTSFRKDEYPD